MKTLKVPLSEISTTSPKFPFTFFFFNVLTSNNILSIIRIDAYIEMKRLVW